MKNILSKPENFFLIFCLFFGLMFAIINPPFQAPDEPEHMYKMYGFTEFSASFKVLNNYPGQILPTNLTSMGKQYKRLIFCNDKKTSKEEILKSLSVPLEKKKTAFSAFGGTSYTPVSYFPQFIVLWFMKLININPLWMMYVLRICSLCVYLALMYTAIRLTPIKKWLFVIIALLPMSLYLAGAVSTDALTLGLCFIFIAYTLRIALDERHTKLTKKDYIIFGVLISLITICKFAYLPLIFMYFMIPKEKFESQKIRHIYFWTLLGINIIYVLIFVLSVIHITKGLNSFWNYTPKSQLELLKFIFTHPITYLKGVAATTAKLLPEYADTLIGRLGWVDTILPKFVTYSYMFLLALAAIFTTSDENENINYDLKDKIIGMMIFLSVYLIALTSVFFIFQHWPIMEGLQGRYLLAAFPLFCLFFNSKKREFKYLPLLITVLSLFLMYGTFIALIKRFYIG